MSDICLLLIKYPTRGVLYTRVFNPQTPVYDCERSGHYTEAWSQRAIMALNGLVESGKEQILAMVAMLSAMAAESKDRWADPYAEAVPGSGKLHRAAQVGTIITVVVIGVVALIGILIFAQINDALPAIENTDLDAASGSVTDGFAGAMELVPVVLLVLVAALVIGVVQRMRMNGA